MAVMHMGAQLRNGRPLLAVVAVVLAQAAAFAPLRTTCRFAPLASSMEWNRDAAGSTSKDTAAVLTSTPPPPADARATAYVDQLLATVAGTDRGVRATDATRKIVDGLVDRLERSYAGADAFAAPDYLFRDTEVVYVGQKNSRAANAAGGKFRGRAGRVLFRTTALYQCLAAGVAVNVVRWRLLGLLPGLAVLRGGLAKEPDVAAYAAKYNTSLSENTVVADFDAPRVAVGPLVFVAGPTSDVRLDTTYLDERIRISRGGSSGIPFVFRALESGDAAPDWRAVADAKPVSAPAAGRAFAVAALAAAGLRRWVPSALCATVAAKLVTSTGGIVVAPKKGA
jgi:hypothetical protein